MNSALSAIPRPRTERPLLRCGPVALGFALAAPVAFANAASPGLPEAKGPVLEYASPQAALSALRAKPGVTEREENDWIVLTDPQTDTTWSIASPRHPAYPTAVKRRPVKEGRQISMKMGILCGASKEVCDHVVLQFQAENEKLRDRVQSSLESRSTPN